MSNFSTFELQSQLGKYCLTGKHAPKSSIDENIYHYHRLVSNVIYDMIERAFPLTIKLIKRKRFKKMIKLFMKKHACQTPQIWLLSKEFSDFYQTEALPFKKEFLFIKELLIYEWLEIEVFMMPDEDFLPFQTKKTSDNPILIPNPEIRIQILTYPFHKKNILNITPDDKGQYFVVIHRDYFTKQVKFNEISYANVEMILQMNEDYTSINDLTKIIEKYETNTDKQKVIINDFIDFALEKNIILGYK